MHDDALILGECIWSFIDRYKWKFSSFGPCWLSWSSPWGSIVFVHIPIFSTWVDELVLSNLPLEFHSQWSIQGFTYTTNKEKPKHNKKQKRKIKRKMKSGRKIRWTWRISKENFTNLVMWITKVNPHQRKCLNHLSTIPGNDAIFWSLGFYRLLDQNKIYNLIHYSIAICTRSKSGFSTNYYSIVVFRYRPQGWIILDN